MPPLHVGKCIRRRLYVYQSVLFLDRRDTYAREMDIYLFDTLKYYNSTTAVVE